MLRQLLFGGAGGGSRAADAGLLVLRVFAGLAMSLTHGLAKLRDPSMIIGGVEKMGLPAPTLMGWLAILGEFGGGLLLALGLLTRPGAFLVANTMIVAAFVAHARDPFRVKELALLYLAVSIFFMLTGSGRYGADALIRGTRPGRRGFPLDRA